MQQRARRSPSSLVHRANLGNLDSMKPLQLRLRDNWHLLCCSSDIKSESGTSCAPLTCVGFGDPILTRALGPQHSTAFSGLGVHLPHVHVPCRNQLGATRAQPCTLPGPQQKYAKYWPVGLVLDVLGHYLADFEGPGTSSTFCRNEAQESWLPKGAMEPEKKPLNGTVVYKGPLFSFHVGFEKM